MSLNGKSEIGDCEVKDHPNTEVWVTPNGIKMCAECIAEEAERTEQRLAQSKKILTDSRAIDATIELSQDICNAKTTPFVELQAAIESNTDIPADNKREALLAEMATRMDILSKAIFENGAEEKAIRAAGMILRNEREAWRINMREIALLQKDKGEKFRQYLSANYTPTSPTKAEKTTKPVKAAKTFDKEAVYAAARKYFVPATEVQMRIVGGSNVKPEKAALAICAQIAKKYKLDETAHLAVVLSGQFISAEDAAKHLAGMMGLL